MFVLIFFHIFSTDQNEFLTVKKNTFEKQNSFSQFWTAEQKVIKKIKRNIQYATFKLLRNQIGQCDAEDTSFVCYNH